MNLIFAQTLTRDSDSPNSLISWDILICAQIGKGSGRDDMQSEVIFRQTLLDQYCSPILLKRKEILICAQTGSYVRDLRGREKKLLREQRSPARPQAEYVRGWHPRPDDRPLESRIKPGRTNALPWCFADFVPTACELAGIRSPAGLDGISIAPTLFGKGKQKRHEYLYWELTRYIAKTGEFQREKPMAAVRLCDWKAVRPKPVN